MSILISRHPKVHERQRTPENPRVCYGTIPIELIRPRPAIRHDADDDDRQQLTPFEFATAVAVIVAARTTWAARQHDEALVAGAELIELEKELADDFHQQWRDTNKARQAGHDAKAPERMHVYNSQYRFKPKDRRRESFRKAGQQGYAEARRRLRKEPAPKVIMVKTSKRQLLNIAGLDLTGPNYQHIEPALERLTRSVRIKPLLRSWQLRSGQLQLEVNGSWLDPQYLRLPLPLPRSAIPLALFLFLRSVKTAAANSNAIRFAELCDVIGIGGWNNRQRDLNRAIAAINRYLTTIPDEVTDELFKFGIKLAASYDVEVKEEYVRFIAKPRPTPEERATAQRSEEIRAWAKANQRRWERQQAESQAKRQQEKLDRELAWQKVTAEQRARELAKSAAEQLASERDDSEEPR